MVYPAFSFSYDFLLCAKSLHTPEHVIVNFPETSVSRPDVNHDGYVVYLAQGIFGDDISSQLGQVVATGQVLPDGNTVTSVFPGGINDNCQISFSVGFTTPGGGAGSAVWRADPSSCPALKCAPPICQP